jgi:hypothetical protein
MPAWAFVVPGEEELGLQRQCSRCGEMWPLDAEFWYRHGRGWHSWCRACHREARDLRWSAKANARAVLLAGHARQ